MQVQLAGLCLKARPTPAQLADRLRPVDGVWPDGLELYLAAADLAEPRLLDDLVGRIQACDVPDRFAWLIEGPVDSLDGADFDVTRQSEADRQVVRRLAELARRIQARAVNIHLIAPGEDLGRLTLTTREALLRRCLPFMREFVDLVGQAGAVPTVENMPPVLRMRRGGFSFTPIGMASQDLLWLVEQVPGLAILPDTSHAGLYLNARAARGCAEFAWSEPFFRYVRQLPQEAADVLGYVKTFEEHIANAQVSNAAGLLGEGLAYAEGEIDLDPVIRWLAQRSSFLVAETLEDRVEDAVNMREALRRMRAALG
jgi:sugar phosphate isomerase/epimerase